MKDGVRGESQEARAGREVSPPEHSHERLEPQMVDLFKPALLHVLARASMC